MGLYKHYLHISSSQETRRMKIRPLFLVLKMPLVLQLFSPEVKELHVYESGIRRLIISQRLTHCL